jgi:hypothetical protein
MLFAFGSAELHCDVRHITTKRLLLLSDQGKRSEGHDLDIMDPPRDRAHRRHLNAGLRCGFSVGQIDSPETIREPSLKRATAAHRDCGNPESLHQEAMASTVMEGVRFFTL